MRSLDKQASLSRRIRQDLADRSKQGLWTHLLCVILALTTTGLPHREPGLVAAAAVAVIVQSLLRGFVLRRLRGGDTVAPIWHRLHVWVLLSCAAMWGIVAGGAVGMFGYSDRATLVILLYHAVARFGIAGLLVHNRRLIVQSIFLLTFPLLIGDIISRENHPMSYLVSALAFSGYCIAQGFKQNRLYQQQISDHYELSVTAYQDSLTGLANRRCMNEALETWVTEAFASHHEMALLYIDLDGFKQINDRHSHKVGDQFLCEAAKRIRESVRADDLPARVGGDEFTVLLHGCCSAEDAIGVAHRVLCSAHAPVVIDGHALHYSASIGISLFPTVANSAELLVRTADEAMYAAKTSGKDRICLALPQGPMPVTLEQLPSLSLPIWETPELRLGVA